LKVLAGLQLLHKGSDNLHQFFLLPELLKSPVVEIRDENAEHMKVLRLKEKDSIILADGLGKQVIAKVISIKNKCFYAKIKKDLDCKTEPPVKVTLIQSLPKKNKIDYILQKGTELGMYQFVPITTARTVVKLNSSKAESRVERWQKIVLEASKQCRRAVVPLVSKITTLDNALNKLNADLILFFWEEEKTVTFKKILNNYSRDKLQSVVVLIGPEGGWTPQEVELVKKYNAKSVTLGPRILRTETAGIAVLTMLLYQLGDLGG
jgi:16S rRNA (uracil1498-N3)-methyltransferase